MVLNVRDRLILLNILPAEGDITTLRIVRDLRGTLSFSEEEHAALKFTENGATIAWDTSAEQSRDVAIGPKAKAIVASTLQKLNAEKKLRVEHMELYEAFCPDE